MKQEIKKELEELGSSLNKKIEPDKPKLPQDYFAKMQLSVLASFGKDSDLEENRMSLWSTILKLFSGWIAPRPALALAGIGAVIISIFVFKPFQKYDSQIFAEADANAIAIYIDNYIDEFDEDLLAEILITDKYFIIESIPESDEIFIQETLEDLDIYDLEELF